MLKLPNRKFRIILLHKKHLIRGFAAIILAIMVVMGTKPSIEAVFNYGSKGKEEVNMGTEIDLNGVEEEIGGQ